MLREFFFNREVIAPLLLCCGRDDRNHVIISRNLTLMFNLKDFTFGFMCWRSTFNGNKTGKETATGNDSPPSATSCQQTSNTVSFCSRCCILKWKSDGMT